MCIHVVCVYTCSGWRFATQVIMIKYLLFLQHQQASSQKPHLELPNPTGPGVATVQVKVPFGSSGLVIGKGESVYTLAASIVD